MKTKSLFFKIYIPFVIILTIAIIILSKLGGKIRVGYLDEIKLNINETLQLNNLESIVENFNNEDELKNYLLNNENITNYSYAFKMGYYEKVFRHSDIYKVRPDFNNLPEFIKTIKMWEIGSPFGNFISGKIIDNEEKININYSLKIKTTFTIYFLSLLPSLLIYFLIKILLCKYLSFFNGHVKLQAQNIFNLDIINKFTIKFILVLSLTIIASIIFKLFGYSNVKTYIFSLIFISVCFLLVNLKEYSFNKKLYNLSLNKEKSEIIIYFTVLFLLLVIINAVLEINIFANQNFILLSIQFIILFFIFMIFANCKYNKYIAVLLFIISVALITYKHYSPSILDNYHYSAHFNSVFYVANSIPYSKNMYSIHGHYALFMFPFFKIFGLSVKSYSLLISILSGITSICIISTIFILIKNSFYRIIGILTTLFFLFTISQNYYSVFPLKLFFPSIMILYISIINISKNKLSFIIGYILASLGILWGADTGLVCLGALVSTHIYIYDLDFKDKKLYYNIILHIILAILSVLLALLILNICNVFVLGGKVQTIKDLLFPLFTGQSKYTESNTRYVIGYWIITIILFLFSFLYYLKDMRIFNFGNNTKIKPHSPTIIYCSICGLGLYCYYINRSDIIHHMIAASSLSVMIPFALYRLNILSLSLKDNNKNYEYNINIIKNIFAIFSLIVIFMSISNFINILNKNFYNDIRAKNDERNGVTYIITEYMRKYGYNGIASFGGTFIYGYANLGWTNSLILPNESDWWNPSFGYSNAVKIFLDKKPDMFFSKQYLENLDVFYHNEENERSIYLFNRYVNMNYTNIPTGYEKYGLYLYKLK